jgi:hypothetical protein
MAAQYKEYIKKLFLRSTSDRVASNHVASLSGFTIAFQSLECLSLGISFLAVPKRKTTFLVLLRRDVHVEAFSYIGHILEEHSSSAGLGLRGRGYERHGGKVFWIVASAYLTQKPASGAL